MRVRLLLAILLLTACSSGPAPTPLGPTSSPTAAPTGVGELRILGTGLTLGEFPFAVRAAIQASELNDLLINLGVTGAPPAVDFEREIVLFLGMSGSSSCPERFERLVVDETANHVYAEWAAHPPGRACTDDLQPQGLLLAAPRAELPDEPFLLSLRDRPICPTCDEHTDQGMVDPRR